MLFPTKAEQSYFATNLTLDKLGNSSFFWKNVRESDNGVFNKFNREERSWSREAGQTFNCQDYVRSELSANWSFSLDSVLDEEKETVEK